MIDDIPKILMISYARRAFYLCLIVVLNVTCANSSNNLNLPQSHIPYYFKLFPDALTMCHKNENCPYKDVEPIDGCWGYEDNCNISNSFLQPVCEGDHKGWVRSKEDQLTTFYTQADFGYVGTHRRTLQVVCEPTFREDSALECSEHLQFCRGRNLLLNLTRLSSFGAWRYRMDVLDPGDLAGFCRLHPTRIEARSDHMSPLQSWAPEIRNFRTRTRRVESTDCDIYIEKPAIIVKIDAAVNMYHHFCDFFNLYASLHVNASHPSAFNTDVEIIIWETMSYKSAFQSVWSAFTDHPVRNVDFYEGKTVCFRNLLLPLPPRMIFGLYYNTPLVYGCERSGLFRAFTQHILHRMRIEKRESNNTIIVTWLSRETSHRNVLNEKDLIEAAGREAGVVVQRVVFDSHTPFRRQLQIMQSTDIFIGMHGAGLTHLLFLPDWAAVFELYNCQDENCYLDLARLRGVKYSTWVQQDKMKVHGSKMHPDGGSHAKFVDYSFDVDEFLRIFLELVRNVRKSKIITANHDEL